MPNAANSGAGSPTLPPYSQDAFSPKHHHPKGAPHTQLCQHYLTNLNTFFVTTNVQATGEVQRFPKAVNSPRELTDLGGFSGSLPNNQNALAIPVPETLLPLQHEFQIEK